MNCIPYTAAGKPIRWSTPPGGYPLNSETFSNVGNVDILNPNGQPGAGDGYVRHKLLIFPNPLIGDEGNPIPQIKVWLIGYSMGVSHFMGYIRISNPYDKYTFNFTESLDMIEIKAASMSGLATVYLNVRYVGLPL